MPSILIELHDGRLDPIELQTPPEKTAAKVLDACSRKFNRGVGSLSPKGKPNLLLEDDDVVADGMTYVFTPRAGSQGVGSQDVRSITREVITELLDAPTMSRILKLAMAKYKGRLQINASGLETGDDVDMDVDTLQMTRRGSSDTVGNAMGGHASSSTDEPSRTVHMSDDVQSQHCSFNLQQMDAVFHQVVMRRLRSPMGYESLGKNKPPLQVEHSSFSDYVKSVKIVG